MMTLAEIEAAHATGVSLHFDRHAIQSSPLGLKATFYPLGHPVEVRTNAAEVLELYEQLWGKFQLRRDEPTTVCEVSLMETQVAECPPEPSCSLAGSQLFFVADRNHYTVSDLDRQRTVVLLTRGALQYPLYTKYFLLMAPLAHLASTVATPIHAACIALGESGVLLCGDSGAGKSTLAYACARDGWTYVTDDASYAEMGHTERAVVGDCHQVRFRPETAVFFPEIQCFPITPRAAGKPSVELRTAALRIYCREKVRVDALVFLKRQAVRQRGGSRPAAPFLRPYPRELARLYLAQTLFAPGTFRERQLASIDRLLTAGVYEMQYNRLEEAESLLRNLVEGDAKRTGERPPRSPRTSL